MYHIQKLSNGITIVSEPIPFVRSIAFGIWVRNGSRNETPSCKGISHFIEHMMFKGTDARSYADIAEEMDAIGGQVNAFTSKEYTCFYTVSLDEHFDTALDILADMFLRSSFPPEELAKEQRVVLEEIDMYEDTPEDLVFEVLQENIWRGSTLGHSILGDPATINSFDRDTLNRYLAANYHPENIVISISGNINPEQVTRKVEGYFGDLRASVAPPSRPDTPAYLGGAYSKVKDIEQVHLLLSFPGIELNSPRLYDMTLLNTILGSGMSSLLFQKVREELGLAYSVYTHYSSYVDTGLFSVYAAVSPQNLEVTCAAINDELKAFSAGALSASRLAKAKEQLKSSLLLSLESSSSRMMRMGRSQLMLGRIHTSDEIIEKIDNVTHENVLDMAKDILRPDKISIATVGARETSSLSLV
ncbi:MAG: insulinase family protein [Defluviitaleaceae bacterium]|nr:insulinase family protein [Defluviitaleaceae bacterium]